MRYLVSFEIPIRQLLGRKITDVECIAMLLKPVTLSCGHSGCENCLTTLARIATPTCHECRAPFTANGLKLNVVMDKMTRALKVKCLSRGCGWRGIYPKAEDHCNECPKLEERCRNEHCTHVAPGKRCQPMRTSARNKSSSAWAANCWYREMAYNTTTT